MKRPISNGFIGTIDAWVSHKHGNDYKSIYKRYSFADASNIIAPNPVPISASQTRLSAKPSGLRIFVYVFLRCKGKKETMSENSPVSDADDETISQ
jgi:hypothetical protein